MKSGSKEVVVVVPDGSYRGARKMASKYATKIPRGKNHQSPKQERDSVKLNLNFANGACLTQCCVDDSVYFRALYLALDMA